MPLPVLPDVVDLAITALAAQSTVTAISPRIVSRTTSTSVYPLYEVFVVDTGEAGDPVLGESRVQVNCWGGGNGPSFDQQALLMARTVRSVSRDLKGTYTGGTIVRCWSELAIPGPDATTGRARFIVDLLITSAA
jgi:hypothetical protein